MANQKKDDRFDEVVALLDRMQKALQSVANSDLVVIHKSNVPAVFRACTIDMEENLMIRLGRVVTIKWVNPTSLYPEGTMRAICTRPAMARPNKRRKYNMYRPTPVLVGGKA